MNKYVVTCSKVEIVVIEAKDASEAVDKAIEQLEANPKAFTGPLDMATAELFKE